MRRWLMVMVLSMTWCWAMYLSMGCGSDKASVSKKTSRRDDGTGVTPIASSGDNHKKATVDGAGEAPAMAWHDAGPGSGIASAGTGGWRQFRGNRARTGAANVDGPRSARLRWAFRTQGRVYSDVAVTSSGETVYVASHDGILYAVSASGRQKWSYDSGGKIWSSPAIGDDGTVFFGTDADKFIALDEAGTEKWHFSTYEPPDSGDAPPESGRFDVDTSPAVLTDGTVVFGSHLSIFALRPASGEIRWTFTAGEGRAKIFSSVAVAQDGSIFFGTQGNIFYALNSSGNVLWRRSTGNDNDSTPVAGPGGVVYFASDDGVVRKVGPGNRLLWEVSVDHPVRAPLGLGVDGTVYVATYGRRPFVLALDGSGTEKWRYFIEPGEGDFYGIQSGITTDKSGYVYFGGRDKIVYCLNPQGQLLWQYRTDDQVDASPALGPDGTLYIGSDDGRVYAFGTVMGPIS